MGATGRAASSGNGCEGVLRSLADRQKPVEAGYPEALADRVGQVVQHRFDTPRREILRAGQHAPEPGANDIADSAQIKDRSPIGASDRPPERCLERLGRGHVEPPPRGRPRTRRPAVQRRFPSRPSTRRFCRGRHARTYSTAVQFRTCPASPRPFPVLPPDHDRRDPKRGTARRKNPLRDPFTTTIRESKTLPPIRPW